MQKINPITPTEHHRNFKKLDYYQLYAIIRKRNKNQGVKPRNKRECLEILGNKNWYNWNRKVNVII